MATKYYCDICEKELTPENIIASFKIIEFDLTGRSGNQPIIKSFDMCKECGQKAKIKILELKNKA
jgi:hypothetical protein